MVSDLYTVLGVGRTATDAQIRGAYRLRALATHPDKGGNEEEFLKASKTEPNQQPVEGWNSTEETQRAKALWLELLEKPLAERKEQLQTLSCRTAEVLLTFAKAQFRGAPVVAGPGAPQVRFLPRSLEVQDAKRAKLDGPRGCFARGSRAHVTLGSGLKVCTGASEDLSEAINWHILLVRVKNLLLGTSWEHVGTKHHGLMAFDEQIATGNTFVSAVRHSVQTALAEASGHLPYKKWTAFKKMRGGGVLKLGQPKKGWFIIISGYGCYGLVMDDLGGFSILSNDHVSVEFCGHELCTLKMLTEHG
eukprot:Skav224153  [mRNA]  locus=scaffold462:446720:450905:- [translate_table: standard]